MGRSTNQHERASRSPRARRSGLIAVRPYEHREPDDRKVLAYGFFAIFAFIAGGAGYLAGALTHVGLGLHTAAALVAFLFALRHAEAL